MAKKGYLGTSPFTHVDDATAPIHTGHLEHQDALIYGGEVAPKHTLEEVVLGPPAFGSPDPRTLGHVMNPVHDSVSAPSLDPDFEELQGKTTSVELLSEEQLNQMSKAEVLDYAASAGITLPSSTKKAKVIETIKDELGVVDSAEENDEDEELVDDDEDDSENS